jgi:hypothetical protein
MESHRYSRRQLSHNKLDSYNALLVDHLHHDLEYWTNGRTTYVNNKVTLSKTVADKVASHVSTSVTPLWKATLSPVSAHRRTMVSSKRPRSTVSSSTQPSDPHVVRNSLLAGSISGMTSTFAMYPLEVRFEYDDGTSFLSPVATFSKRCSLSRIHFLFSSFNATTGHSYQNAVQFFAQ